MHTAFTREVLQRAQWLPSAMYVILLGANLGDPKKQLSIAREHMKQAFGNPIAVSSLYRSAAWGFESEDYFLNQVLVLACPQAPNQVLHQLKAIEQRMGRTKKRGTGYESRLIDLDILFRGSLCYQEPVVTIPHPLLHKRKFTTAPLAELLPNYIHPTQKQDLRSINALLTEEVSPLV